MYTAQLPTAAGNQITATTTATSLLELIRTALSDSTYTFPAGVNAMNIQPEGASIRFLFDGNAPTTSLGQLVSANFLDTSVRGETLEKVKIIALSGTVACNIHIGFTNPKQS
jgi:hypothetical protein